MSKNWRFLFSTIVAIFVLTISFPITTAEGQGVEAGGSLFPPTASEKLKKHVDELKEKLKKAKEAGKTDEVKDLTEDLESIRQSLGNKKLRDPDIPDEDAGKLFHDISDFLGIDPYLELMPPGSMQLPPLKPDPDVPMPPEEEAEPKGELEETEPPIFDYDQSPFQEVIASVEVREKEKKKPPAQLSCENATTLMEKGLLAMEVTGTGTTSGLVFNLANKTNEHLCVIIPTGTLVLTTAEGYQPYQTGRIPPIVLEPGETLTREFPAYCTNNSLEPAPTDASVKYALQTGPLTEQGQKVAELITVTQGMHDIYEHCGEVAEPEDILPEWRAAMHAGIDLTEDIAAAVHMRTQWLVSPEMPPASGVHEAPQYGLGELQAPLWWWPDSLFTLLDPDWYAFNTSPFSFGPFGLEGPLTFPGTIKFGLKEDLFELKPALTYYMEDNEQKKGELSVANPTGDVEVSVDFTDNPDVVSFNINSLNGSSPSLVVHGEDRGDINFALNSPENSTGSLNIKTGEVRGTASIKAWGKKYKEPFPVAVSYKGNFDFSTRELDLELSGISFEPVKMEEQGLYQLTQTEKFWDAVQLYTIWDETNDVGKKELNKVMTEQLKAEFPEERAEELSNMVTKEIMSKVKEVKKLHKELKEDEIDFSKLDPTLKWRKT